MITPQQHRWIEQLLDEGQLSQRQIAQAAGVCRSTVQRIATGTWQGGLYFNPGDEPPPEERPVRCNGCGGLVYPPCRLCRLRWWQGQRSARNRRARRAPGAQHCHTAKRCGGKSARAKSAKPESG